MKYKYLKQHGWISKVKENKRLNVVGSYLYEVLEKANLMVEENRWAAAGGMGLTTKRNFSGTEMLYILIVEMVGNYTHLLKLIKQHT